MLGRCMYYNMAYGFLAISQHLITTKIVLVTSELNKALLKKNFIITVI